VVPLAAALAAQGWSVWWDPEITPGQEFDRLINDELGAAKAVIVVWMPAPVESRWVRGEARIGAERGCWGRCASLTVPLANDARFQALKAKLEAQMAALKLE
jgi:TIR domain